MGGSRKRLDIPKLSKLELQIMERFWTVGESSVRDIHEGFSRKPLPAYTTLQTIVGRLENKGVVKRVGKSGNSHIFAAAITRNDAQRRLVDDLLSLFGGRIQPVIAHLIQTDNVTSEDLVEAQNLFYQRTKQGEDVR